MSEDFVEVIDADTISRRVGELADEIVADHPDGDLVVVGILKGSLIFMKDLLDRLPLDSTPQFLALTRFGNHGRVSLTLDIDQPLDERDVLLVMGIVDTGLTLSTIRTMLQDKGARSVRTVTLIDKAPRRIVEVPVEYRGFEVGDEYLLGYGFDWHGYFRNLGSVWAVMNMPLFLEQPETFVEVAYNAAKVRNAR